MPFPVIERWYDGPFNICCKDYEKTLNISLSPDYICQTFKKYNCVYRVTKPTSELASM